MKNEIENIIENYAGLGTIEPRAGFEAQVRRKIEYGLAAEPLFGRYALKPALIIMILILNFATVFTVAIQDTNASSGEENIASIAEEYNVIYNDSFTYLYDGVN